MAKQKKPRLTKSDLDARFTAQQEKNRARRANKVTPEDVAKHFAERKANRGARPAPGQRARVVSLGLGIALLIGSGAMAVATTSSTSTFEVETEANIQRIASATGDLATIPASDDVAAGEYAAELEAQIAAATAKGEEVAALQQEFSAILFKGNGETAANGGATPALIAAVEHRRLLAPYFVERSLFVEDAEAYAPGSILPFDDDEIDPRFPWYVGYAPGSQGAIVLDPTTSSWELTSLVATVTPGVLEATWLNSSTGTGDLLAWATASYYVDPGAFGSLTLGKTTLGERGDATIETAGE